jgi:hypothetical protein
MLPVETSVPISNPVPLSVHTCDNGCTWLDYQHSFGLYLHATFLQIYSCEGWALHL